MDLPRKKRKANLNAILGEINKRSKRIKYEIDQLNRTATITAPPGKVWKVHEGKFLCYWAPNTKADIFFNDILADIKQGLINEKVKYEH